MKIVKILVFILFITLSIFGFLALNGSNKSEVNLVYAPGYATIKIDGKNFKKTSCSKELCKDKLKVDKGSKQISIIKDNFSTVATEIKFSPGNQIFLISSPINEAGQDEYNNSELMQRQIQNASSEQFSYGSKKISERYPFLDQLNIYGGGFTVGYGQASNSTRDPYSIALYIDGTEPEYRLKAIDSIITDLNVSPADIEIIYSDFNNPFMEEK